MLKLKIIKIFTQNKQFEAITIVDSLGEIIQKESPYFFWNSFVYGY